MNSLKTIFSKHWWFILLVIAFSCTIIQDSDITSADQASQLKLSSINIDQTLNSGNFSSVIQVTVTQTVNYVYPEGTVNRVVSMNFPALSATGKLKLRSGQTSALKAYTSYYNTGKPRTFAIFKENLLNGVVKDTTYYEVYRFRYESSGRLNKIVTFINPTNPCCTTPTVNDTIIYASNKVTAITRRSPDVSKTGTGAFTYTNGGSYPSPVKFIINNVETTFNPAGGFCYTCNNEFNNSYTVERHPSSGGGSNNYISLTYNNVYTKPQKFSIQDQLGNNSGVPNHNPDTYYFHPLMILQGDVGSLFIDLYMIDWWIPGGSSSTSYSTNDVVKLTFNYVK